MKKILIHGGFHPLEDPDTSDMLSRKTAIGGNTGNMLFINAMIRTLMTEDVEIVPDYYRVRLTSGQIKKINDNYSLFCIPLADAFRAGNEPQLERLAALVDRLTIPVIITGVGLRADYRQKLEDYPFDGAVKKLMNAVLRRSSMVGLRGAFTGEYLKKLGYIPEKDFTVIGCPSMYTYGPELIIRDFNTKPDAKLTVNANTLAPDYISSYITSVMKSYDDVTVIQQKQSEISHVYLGGDVPENVYGDDVYLKMVKENRIKYFSSVNSWTEYLATRDVTLNTRFHGTVASVQAGTPSVVIPIDSRMKELAEYHRLPAVRMEDIKSGKIKTLEDAVGMVDITAMQDAQNKNFEHFLDFLRKNEVTTIYDDGQTSAYDKKAIGKKWTYQEESYCNVDDKELKKRQSLVNRKKKISYYKQHFKLV